MSVSTGLASCLVAALVSQGPSGPPPPLPPSPSVLQPEETRVLRVEIAGFEEAAVMSGLRLRLPQLEVESHETPLRRTSPYAYVWLSRDAPTLGRIRILTLERRAYERTFTIEDADAARTAASTAANLLYSIEQGTIAPDQQDVPLPEPTLEPDLADSRASASEPVTTPTESSPSPSPPAPPVEPAPGAVNHGWELTAGLLGASVVALGRPQLAGAFAGAGGGLSVEARSPRGAALGLDVRGLGRDGSTFTVGRLRLGLAAGFTWRRRRFELPVLVGASVEPWWAVQSGASAPIYDVDTVTERPPLVGGYVRLTPALRLAVGRTPLAAVRIGPRIELAGSVSADRNAHLIGLTDVSGQPRARLGGLELTLGIELALQWSLASSHSR